MMKHRTRRLSVRRAFALTALTFVMVGGAAACQPRTQILDHTPPAADGRLALTVTKDGKPVDADVNLLTRSGGGMMRSVETGTDGTVTVSLPAGRWVMAAHARGDHLPGDPMCWYTFDNDPAPRVNVVAGHTRHLAIALQPGGVVCA